MGAAELRQDIDAWEREQAREAHARDAAARFVGGCAVKVTKPGVYELDDATYHADPVPSGSLSSTGARRILDSPARFRWEQQHRVEKVAFDIGHAVHRKVLGVGVDVVVVDADSWRTKAAREERDAAYAAGKTPLLAADVAPINAMADAILAHPLAKALLERPGQPEASAFAPDPDTGTWLRARPDFLAEPGKGRTILADVKTTRSADPRRFGRTAWDFHYEQQDALYQDVVRMARGDDDTAFVFVLVETEAPHLVSVVELDEPARRIGRERNRRAIDLFTHCRTTDTWPGYPTDVAAVSLPRYAEYDHEELMSA